MAYKQLKLWFDGELAALLADKILALNTEFSKDIFVTEIDDLVSSLELKDRVELIADKLDDSLSGTYLEKLEILVKILGPENPNETGMFTEGYWVMPIAKFVEKYGLDHPNESLEAIGEITKRNTGEYAIRPYIVEHRALTLKKMNDWATASNFHLRRLASEGLRIRLPWAKKFDFFADDPSPIIRVIELLKDDTKKFVQKSVANSLNDIFKERLEIGKRLIESWLSDDLSKNRKWIITHSLRKLKKEENEWALSILRKIQS